MKLRYLLDTNALAEPVRAQLNATFMARLAEHRDSCAIASVTWHEALYGMARLAPGARQKALRHYLHDVVAATLPILRYDDAAAAWHAKVRADRERVGRPLAFADGQIAAIAQVHGLVVVTANVSDFAGLDGIVVENWAES